jgi:uncharacterized OsmC-like protein
VIIVALVAARACVNIAVVVAAIEKRINVRVIVAKHSWHSADSAEKLNACCGKT